MKVYVYAAALWCEDCATALKADLRKTASDYDFRVVSGDSDDWPQGPFGQGGGEADTPQHCEKCGVFLENPLTCDPERAHDKIAAKGIFYYSEQPATCPLEQCGRRTEFDGGHKDVQGKRVGHERCPVHGILYFMELEP